MAMASFAISIFSLATVAPTCKNYRPFLSQTTYTFKSISIRASSTSLDYSTPSSVNEQKSLKPTKTNYWEWKFKDNVIDVYYEEHEHESTGPQKNILMMPTISDVSTVEEWRGVAKDILERSGKLNLRATIVDWPGLGFSSRPKMDYDADVMENFVVDFINEISSSGGYLDPLFLLYLFIQSCASSFLIASIVFDDLLEWL
ncbi:hypothetical protein Gogos_010176 [Gossypium gossypioides]|uniref:Serine aminopeptidase S33 domain-containing protein n=1 Tax=Gossypium gossypioides TaxID=34282 RepID=A0A7J9BKD2_GOSGO|nr:hypothetical protein [Gossypium gossypioides]